MNIHIGIDVGTHTGFAVFYNKKLRQVETLKLHQALFKVYSINESAKVNGDKVILHVEDPNTWVKFGYVSKKESDAKKQGAGSVKRDFAIWRDFAEDLGIELRPVNLHSNLKKLKAPMFQKVTGWIGRTSEHSRDAAMMVYGVK